MQGRSAYDFLVDAVQAHLKGYPPLADAILDRLPKPAVDKNSPLQLQVTMLDYSNYLGRIGIGRITNGKISVSDNVILVKREGGNKRVKVTGLEGLTG